jgi:hypothetical protein
MKNLIELKNELMEKVENELKKMVIPFGYIPSEASNYGHHGHRFLFMNKNKCVNVYTDLFDLSMVFSPVDGKDTRVKDFKELKKILKAYALVN